MIVALLVLIVLILLFGAGVVKGWIANTITMGCGFIAICLAPIWLGSFFGENGFLYVLLVIGGIMLLFAAFATIFNEQAPTQRPNSLRPLAASHRLRPTPKPQPPPEPPAVDRVWGWFAHDIVLRFSPEARATAHQLYDSGDANGLDRFCRAEIARLEWSTLSRLQLSISYHGRINSNDGVCGSWLVYPQDLCTLPTLIVKA